MMAEAIETGDAGLLVTGDRLAVDDARVRPQLGQGLDDQRELPRQVVAPDGRVRGRNGGMGRVLGMAEGGVKLNQRH